jgi:hypothetical protein
MSQTFAPDGDADLHPVDVLINALVTLLAPMFIAGAEGNMRLARAAALETITSYSVQNHASLMAVAKIIAFGLCTLGSLSLSMLDDVSIPLILRLRGNANALDRSCERSERALQEARALPPAEAPGAGFGAAAIRAGVANAQQRTAECHPRTQPPAPPAEPAPAPTPAPAPAAKPAEPSYRTQWAAAMAQVAAEELAEAAHLPPAQRREAEERAAILRGTANSLFSAAGQAPRGAAGEPADPPIRGYRPAETGV